jgi:hypothetical protein
VVSRQALNTVTWVQLWGSRRGICGGELQMEKVSHMTFCFFLPITAPPMPSTLLYIGLYFHGKNPSQP